MLELPFLRDNQELVVKKLTDRFLKNADIVLADIIKTDENRRNTQNELDSILSETNAISKQIGALMKEGNKEEAEKVKIKTGELKEKSKVLQGQLKDFEEDLTKQLLNVPNLPQDNVPVGKTEDDNEIVAEFPKEINLPSNAQPHWDLIKKYDIIDFDLGNKITGAGFPVYKGKGAKLQRALINFFLDEAEKAGFNEVAVPIMINEESGYGTGQLPDKEGQMYHIAEENYFLIPTGEVPITNMYRNVIVNPKTLPIKNTGVTPCFRREAGSWGAHVRGLNRLHQFDKVEIVQITLPENSDTALIEMRDYICSLLDKLELPYRILNLCTGDLGFTASITYDMEVYSAAQEKWLEVSSVSNFQTYQANRLKLRYKDENKRTQLLHTLNGSALALPRIVASILENNQNENGITIPKALVPYTGFDTIS